MAEKKLTKVQKEILQTLRDNPKARVRSEYNNVYRLYIGDKQERTIIWDTWLFLRTWLKEEPYRDRFGRTLYAFKPGAEISDAWRNEEIERQRAEAQRKREEDQRRKEQEESDRERRIREAFGAIERGEIVGELQFNGYRLGFEYGGKWYSLAEER